MGTGISERTTTTAAESQSALEDWLNKDALVQRIFITTVEKSVLLHLMDFTTVQELWKKLKDTFQQNAEQLKCNLWQNFYGFPWEKGGSVGDQLCKI